MIRRNIILLLLLVSVLPATFAPAQVPSVPRAETLPVEERDAAADADEHPENQIRPALEYASELIANGDTLGAARVYRRVFEVAPDNEIAARGFVEQISRLGETRAEITRQSETLAKSPRDSAARLMLAELLRSEARYTDALAHYWLAWRGHRTKAGALRGIAESLLGAGSSSSVEEIFAQIGARDGRAREAASKARVLLADDRPEAALATLLALKSDVDKDSSALLVLADVYRALGRSADELGALKTASALDKETNAPVHERLARASFESGEREAARVACERVLKSDLRNVTCAFGLTLLGTPSLASDATLQEQLAPRRAAYERDAGEAALFWNRPEQAVTYLRRALAAYDDSPRVAFALGTALLRTNDADAAATAFARVNDNRNLNALLLRARANLVGGKHEQALAIYRYVLDAEPKNLPATLGETDALRRLGAAERSALTLTRLAREAPENDAINSRLRDVLIELGRPYRVKPASARFVEPLLEAGDKLKFKVVGKPALNAEIRVDENGFAELPFAAERVNVRCSTARELQDVIAERSRERIGDAKVELSFAEYSRLPLFIAGAVYLPGKFNIRVPVALRESLMLAGGAKPVAGRTVHVLRGAVSCDGDARDDAAVVFETYDRGAVEAGQVNSARPLRVGDLIVVPEAAQVFVTGAVARPSALAARDGLTLLEAVKSLGGTTREARREDVRLLRLTPDGASYQKFAINLDDIERQRVGDVVLRAGDIVEVYTSGARSARQPYYSFWREALEGARTREPQGSVAKRPS